MEKWLCWGSIGVAGLLLLLFLLDLFLPPSVAPFQGISPAVDVMGAICCGILGYLGWNALKDLG